MSVQIHRNEDRDGEVAEGAVAFTLTKPIDPAALDAELSGEMNWRKDGGIVAEGNPAEASEDNPVTIWVTREDVDAKALQSVVGAHEASGQPQEDPLEVFREKARAGEDFDPDEIQTLLRSMVLALF